MRKLLSILAAFVVGLWTFNGFADDYPGVVFSQPNKNTLKITWTEGSYFGTTNGTATDNDAYNAYITGGNLTSPAYIRRSMISKDETYSKNSSLNFNISSLNLEDGDYTLTLPDGYILVYTTSGGSITTTEMQFQFTLGGNTGPATPDYTYEARFTDPNYRVYINGATSVEKGTAVGAQLENLTDNTTYNNLAFSNQRDYSNCNIVLDQPNNFVLNLSVNNLGATTGNYKLKIPAGYFKFDGADCPAFEVGGIYYEKASDPATSQEIKWSLKNGNKLYFTFASVNEQTIVGLSIADADKRAYINTNIYQYSKKPTISDFSFIIDIQEEIQYNDIDRGGTYSVKIPEGLFAIDLYDGSKVVNMEQTIPFVFADYAEVDATWDPLSANFVGGQDAMVEVFWSGASDLTHVEDAPEIKANYIDFSSTTSVELKYGEDVTIDGAKLKIDLSKLPALPEGQTYSIDIPAAYVTMDIDGTIYINNATYHSYGMVAAGSASGSKVTFYINSDDLGEPSKYIRIYNATDDEEIYPTANMYEFSYSGEKNMFVTQNWDYEIPGYEITISSEDYNGSLYNDFGTINFTLDESNNGNEFTISINKASAIDEVEVTFQLQTNEFGDNPVPSSELDDSIIISYFDRTSFQEVIVSDFQNNKAIVTLAPGTNVTLTPKRGYGIEFISGGRAVGTISNPAEGENEWYISISETPEDETGTFWIDVVTVPVEEPEAVVTFKFEAGEDDLDVVPYEVVNVMELTDYTLLTKDSDTLEVPLTEEITYNIYPGDLDYELTVEVDGAVLGSDYELESEDGEYLLHLTPEAAGAIVTVKVYNKGNAPSDGSAEVTTVFQFNGVDNAGDYVEVSYFDRNTFQQVDVEITENSAQAIVGAGWNITLTPSPGYKITEISSLFGDFEGLAYISEPADANGEWNISIAEKPLQDFILFMVNVAEADAMVTINFEGAQGIFSPSNYVTATGFNVNANEGNTLYLTEDKTQFSVAGKTVEGIQYAITGVSILNGSDNVTLEGLDAFDSSYTLEDGTYTFTLGKKANGLVFTFTVGQKPTELNNNFTVTFDENEPSTILITWNNEVTSIEFAMEDGAYLLDSNNLMTGLANVVNANDEGQISISGNTVAIDLSSIEDLANGEYTLVIPEGYFALTWGSTYGTNPEISKEFELVGGQVSGIGLIGNEGDNVRYFNLNGVELSNPQPGTIVIRIQGNKVDKVVVK